MITLRDTLESDLPQIVELEQDSDVKDYIIPYSLEKHRNNLLADNMTYLTIEQDGAFAGFIILVEHQDENSIECARIALGIRGSGIGQIALGLMEDYCKSRFNPKRIWLDVFEFNARGVHVYTKLGYRQFDTSSHQGKKLLLMEKFLTQ